MLPGEAELKRQELKDAKLFVQEAEQQLKGEIFLHGSIKSLIMKLRLLSHVFAEVLLCRDL